MQLVNEKEFDELIKKNTLFCKLVYALSYVKTNFGTCWKRIYRCRFC